MKTKTFFRENYLEIIVLLLFCTLTIFLSFFHEPWFDELQAWGIAKDNLYNIIFVIPHMEGHPPLWHLILKVFQQFIDNPELVLKIPNLLIMYFAIGLLIFKSPFPKILRLTLPFTYYLFYQYTIISRPYSLLILSMFLAAVFYKTRDEKPFRFTLALAVLSLSCIYGMVITSGICIEWGLSILFIQKQNIKDFFTKDKRFFSMLGLFLLCVVLSVLVFPDKDVFGTSKFLGLPLWQKMLYFAYGLPSDATAFNILNYDTQDFKSIFSLYSFVGITFGGYFLLNLIRIFKSNGKLILFLVIYITVVSFMNTFYIHPHHIGIITILFIYCFWCLMSEVKDCKFPKYFNHLIFWIIIIQIYWSAFSFVIDMNYLYGTGRDIAQYIKDNRLTDYKIMCTYYSESPHMSWIGTVINPYFNKNIFYNYNIENPDKLYLIHINGSKKNARKLYSKYKEMGPADVIVSDMTGLIVRWNNVLYVRVKVFKKEGFGYKDSYANFHNDIYIRKDLLKDLKLKGEYNGE